MAIKFRKEDAPVNYHTQGKPGKNRSSPTKTSFQSNDLALAYSPGVAGALQGDLKQT